MNFTGAFTGPSLDIRNMSGTINGSNTATGQLLGVFAGQRADALGGVFELKDSANSANGANGSFIVQCSTCP